MAGDRTSSACATTCSRSMIDVGDVADDVALIAVRPLPIAERAAPHAPSPPRHGCSSQARGSLRRWLREAGVRPTWRTSMLVACGEACANVVQHAYAAAPRALELEASLA